MSTLRCLGLATAVALVAGCTDTVAPADPAPGASPPISAAQGGNSGPSASGHINFTVGGGLQTFSFHAREKKDGTVQGSFQVKSRGQATTVHGSIDCLTVVGNEAFLNGVVSKINEDSPLIGLLPVGSRVYFGVQDNGEGAGATDAWTDLFPAFAFAGCPDFDFPFLPSEGGNVQVKP